MTLPRRLALLSAFALVAAGCAHRTYTPQTPAPVPQPSAPSAPPPSVETQPAIPGQYVEEGVASWYGVPFNGHRTSNGEIYDMHHSPPRTARCLSARIVRVTNLRNGKQTEVRINDRGPFVANRVIDLSLSAAQAIDMVGPGTAPVRLEVVSGPNPTAGLLRRAGRRVPDAGQCRIAPRPACARYSSGEHCDVRFAEWNLLPRARGSLADRRSGAPARRSVALQRAVHHLRRASRQLMLTSRSPRFRITM